MRGLEYPVLDIRGENRTRPILNGGRKDLILRKNVPEGI
jgi:hypothetical protein